MRLSAVRAANKVRNEMWAGAGKIDLPFRGLELAGEVGELCNLLKKLHRHRVGIAGNRHLDPLEEDRLLSAIEEELGDALTTLDLVAMDLGVDLASAFAAKFNRVSERQNLPVFIGIDWAKPGSEMTVFHENTNSEGA